MSKLEQVLSVLCAIEQLVSRARLEIQSEVTTPPIAAAAIAGAEAIHELRFLAGVRNGRYKISLNGKSISVTGSQLLGILLLAVAMLCAGDDDYPGLVADNRIKPGGPLFKMAGYSSLAKLIQPTRLGLSNLEPGRSGSEKDSGYNRDLILTQILRKLGTRITGYKLACEPEVIDIAPLAKWAKVHTVADPRILEVLAFYKQHRH